MFEKSKVSGLSACFLGQGEDSSPRNFDDIMNMETQEIGESNHKKVHAPRGTKRKGVKSPNKKAKHPIVRVMSKMVDDAISTNSVTSKAIQGDLMKEDICETMKLAKEAGAIKGSDEHYMATRLFVKSENRAVFMTLETNEGRLNWLKRCYEDRKKYIVTFSMISSIKKCILYFVLVLIQHGTLVL
jgi:histone deacetylase complex regulatory component SIN3